MIVIKRQVSGNSCFIETDERKQLKILLDSYGLYEPSLRYTNSIFAQQNKLIVLWSDYDFFISDTPHVVILQPGISFESQLEKLGDDFYIVDHIRAQYLSHRDIVIVNFYLHKLSNCTEALQDLFNTFWRKTTIDEFLKCN